MLNKAQLIGRCGRDPELRFTPSGKAVANFTLATNEYWTEDGERKERTEWHKIVIWGKQAETASKILAKGKLVYIEGRLQTRPWDDKEGKKQYTTEIVANIFQVLEAKEQEQAEDAGQGDDIPF
jgi:single-strand DNA-binding protein